jgi:hypothetical protein
MIFCQKNGRFSQVQVAKMHTVKLADAKHRTSE